MTKLVILSAMEILQCEQFALDSIDTHLRHYQRRGQTNKEKILRDITVGKMGELALYIYLSKSVSFASTAPDFEIHKGGRKRFGADLFLTQGGEQYPVHIKTQDKSSSDKYGDSWLFQWGGAGLGHTDKIFKSYDPKELFAACNVNGQNVVILGIWHLKDLFENDLFKEPRLQWFKNTKKALYLKDIEEAGIINLLNSIV